MTTASILPYAFPALFVCFWIFLASMFRLISGFSWKTSKHYAHARAIERADFSSGQIRGVSFRTCLHVIRIDGGFLLKLSRLFLGGSRFIADGEILKAEKGTTLFWFATLTISISGEKLVFYGAAIDMMMKYLDTPLKTAPAP